MSRGRRALLPVVAAVAAALLLLDAGTFALMPAQQALILRFGRLVATDVVPGLKFKLPFIDSAVVYDSRLQALEPPTELIILGDQKRVEVDTYTLFRINDPARFAQTVQSLSQARAQITQIVGSSLRRVLGRKMLPALLSDQRTAIIAAIRQEVAENTRPLGIAVVDVRIRRADLPLETSQAIYDRMTSERQREAKELRAQGFEWAQEITARADADRTVLLAEAQRAARIARSAGEAEADRLFADAAARDPKFFAFYRAMQTYRGAMAKAAPTVVLSPRSALLRFFNGGIAPGDEAAGPAVAAMAAGAATGNAAAGGARAP